MKKSEKRRASGKNKTAPSFFWGRVPDVRRKIKLNKNLKRGVEKGEMRCELIELGNYFKAQEGRYTAL